jgi:hypothetical protein
MDIKQTKAVLVNHIATDASNGCLGKNTLVIWQRKGQRYRPLQKSTQKECKKAVHSYVSDVVQEDSNSNIKKKTLPFHKE